MAIPCWSVEARGEVRPEQSNLLFLKDRFLSHRGSNVIVSAGQDPVPICRIAEPGFWHPYPFLRAADCVRTRSVRLDLRELHDNVPLCSQ